ncbi:hypothetical protein V6N13_055870 [Hibiscus sabdariffa]
MPSRWGEFVTPTRPTTRGFGHVDARSHWLCAARLDNVTPNTGRPCVATVLGGVSRPSNVRASDLIKFSVGTAAAPPSPPLSRPDTTKKAAAARLWCALAHCFLRSSTESFGRVGCGPVGVDAATCTQRACEW